MPRLSGAKLYHAAMCIRCPSWVEDTTECERLRGESYGTCTHPGKDYNQRLGGANSCVAHMDEVKNAISRVHRVEGSAKAKVTRGANKTKRDFLDSVFGQFKESKTLKEAFS
jgi:hypothetical protein